MGFETEKGPASSQPLITTIIPTFCRPKLLQRAIRSVLNQTYSNFQVCIYDNASGDETEEIVAKFIKNDQRIKYHCHPQNIGAIANFNYGMLRVETPFFSFLSDDDILLPDFYSLALDGLDKFSDAVFFAGSVILITNTKKIILDQLSSWPREGRYSPPEGLFRMLEMNHPTWTGILFRREVIEHIGILDHEVGELADMDFELRIAARCPFIISKKPCAIYFVHPLSFSSLKDRDFFWPGLMKSTELMKSIGNVLDSQGVPHDVKKHAEKLLLRQTRDSLYGTGFIRRKNFKDSYRASKILYYHFGEKRKGIILYFLTKLVDVVPAFNYVLDMREKYRKMHKSRNSEELQKKYAKYLQFIDF